MVNINCKLLYSYCSHCTGMISALNLQSHSHLAVIADVQRPKVSLETPQFHFEDAYVDIEKQFSTKLINTGFSAAKNSDFVLILGFLTMKIS